MIAKRPPKSDAERSCEYRERQKRKRAADAEKYNQFLKIAKRVPKSGAERSREYRERRKRKRASTENASAEFTTNSIDEWSAKSGTVAHKRAKGTPMTNAEKQRAYRLRKKLGESRNIVDAAEKVVRAKKTPMTNAEKQREYRLRKKLRENPSIVDEEVVRARTPMTNAEKQREYRLRRKLRENSNIVDEEVVRARTPMTNAKKQREYRLRKKLRENPDIVNAALEVKICEINLHYMPPPHQVADVELQKRPHGSIS